MFSSENWFGASPSFYNGVATQSLRLDGGTEITLDNAGAGTSNKIATISVWFKRADETTTLAYLFHSKNSGSFNDGANGNASFSITLDATDTISVVQYNGNTTFNASQYDFGVQIQNRVFRDMSSWYHLVVAIDTTQGSGTTNEADRIKMYVNGTQQTVVAISDGSGYQDFADENQLIAVNQAGDQRWGGTVDDGNYAHVYLAETNVVDGLQLDASYFGETKNGVWIAKAPNVSEYGNHGYRLQFKETGVGTGASNTVGADTSDKNNHFTTHSNIVAYDCAMPDSPENNFATLNPLYMSAGTTTEGNLRYDNSAWNQIASTFAFSSGKWYFEVRADSYDSSAQALTVGIREAGGRSYAIWWHHSSWDNSLDGYVYGVNVNGTTEYKITGTSEVSIESSAPEIVANSVIGIAIDLDSSTTSIKYNVDGGTLFTLFEDMEALTYHPAINGYQAQATVNFGQDSSFAGQETATTNSDANGNGTFHSAVPSGYLALCSANLPEPTISPNADTQADDYFNTALWGGNSGTQDVVVGFQPDWVWLKVRNHTYFHELYDSSRGATKKLRSNNDSEEATQSDGVTDFTASGGGFSLGAGAGGNESSKTYVAWNWKAGGATPTKTYKVVVVSDSGNKYRFRNSADSATFAQSAVTLDLQEGGIYTFDYSDSTATSHPFRFSTTSDGTHGGGSEYTTGVVKDDTAKTITITVASSAPTLYYYCSAHSGMGGQVNTNATSGQTNFDGSVLSVSNANTDAGFSIVTYTSNNSNSTTIGHGLDIKPDIMFQKNRSVTSNWLALHQLADGSLDYHLLDSTSAGGAGVQPVATTSTVATWKSSGSDTTGNLMVAYCFSSIEGYSKMGSYTGNGDPDGTFVFTGFRPAYVMVKRSDADNNWVINDTTRSPFNEITGSSSTLYADTNNAESDLNTNVDFLSNGFKARTDAGHRNASGRYIYMAFAEAPFKYANAR